jgi:hypothetical protein
MNPTSVASLPKTEWLCSPVSLSLALLLHATFVSKKKLKLKRKMIMWRFTNICSSYLTVLQKKNFRYAYSDVRITELTAFTLKEE